MKRGSIVFKIWLGILAILVGYITAVVSFHLCSEMVFKSMEVVADSRIPAARIGQKTLNAFNNHVKLFNDSVLLGDPIKIAEAKEMGADCAEDLKFLLTLLDKNTSLYTDVNEIISSLTDYTETAAKTYAALAEGSDDETILTTAADLAKQKTELQAGLLKIEQMTADEIRISLNQIRSYLQEKTRLNIVVFAVMLFICLGLVNFIIKKYVMKPLNEITASAKEMEKGSFNNTLTYESNDEIGVLADAFRAMAASQIMKIDLTEQIAQGDLTCEVALASDQDRLGLALDEMISSLNSVIVQIDETTSQVVQKSDQMFNASQSLSEGAIQSASSLEEISGSVAQIEGQTVTNVEHAEEATRLAMTTKDAAEIGNQNMHELVASITDIRESSNQVGRIIKVIDDIAFQTNLLALNAAVEAARAGRHGKGFAVVADEVRNLAGRSAKAARETAEMINASGEKVMIGTQIAAKTEVSLKNIVESAVKMVNLISEITTASKEQANSIAQIMQSLGQIDTVTQQNAGNAEETAAASEELSNQAAELKKQINRFRLK